MMIEHQECFTNKYFELFNNMQRVHRARTGVMMNWSNHNILLKNGLKRVAQKKHGMQGEQMMGDDEDVKRTRLIRFVDTSIINFIIYSSTYSSDW